MLFQLPNVDPFDKLLSHRNLLFLLFTHFLTDFLTHRHKFSQNNMPQSYSTPQFPKFCSFLFGGWGSVTQVHFQIDWSIILTMSKQAILMIIDVGHSMDQAFSDGTSRAKIALECCKLTLQQKLFNNSSHQLGLVLFGDSESDDGNSLILQDIDKPSVDFVRKVQQLSDARFDSPKPGGDIFSSINYSITLLNSHCGKKKYNKRMFLFTNGMGETDFDNNDIRTLAGKIQESGIKLNIIPIDFMTTYSPEQNELEGEMMLEPIQERNAQMLMKLKERVNDYVQIFPASLAIELYRKFRKRDTNPVALYKGVMEIAPGLGIDVCTYKAIKREKLKSLARYDTSVPFDPIIPKEKEIILETNYTVQGDQTGKIVEPQNIINAFNYGPQLVPISSILEVGSKIHEEKNLRFLGFVEKEKIPRHCLMGEVDIVVPTEGQAGRKLFTAFIYSMISLNKYAIARYVARNYKRGVNPKMVVLIPYRSADRQMFYLIELPTVQDVRDYPFNSLKQSTEAQKEIVRGLIDKMMLYHKTDDDYQEEVKVETTFNPTRQYFYQTLFYRALNDDATDVPPLDPVIKEYLTPENRIFAATEDITRMAKKEFKFVKKLNLQEKKNKAKILTWKQVISLDAVEIKPVSQPSQTASVASEQHQMIAQFNKLSLKFSAEDEDNGTIFDPSNPILSFRKMISCNKNDMVSQALNQMDKYISERLNFSIGANFKEIGKCAAEMRLACATEQEEKYWDDWLNYFKKKNRLFYDHLISQGVGLIKGDNVEIYRPTKELHPQVNDIVEELD